MHVYMCTCVPSAHRGQKRASYPLRLELQMQVALWILGAEWRFSKRIASAFNLLSYFLIPSLFLIFPVFSFYLGVSMSMYRGTERWGKGKWKEETEEMG